MDKLSIVFHPEYVAPQSTLHLAFGHQENIEAKETHRLRHSYGDYSDFSTIFIRYIRVDRYPEDGR